MIALDTNLLLRVFIDDDAAQHATAMAFLLAHRSVEGEPPQLFVPPVVLCELAWVLRSSYGQPKSTILRVFDAVLDSRDIEIGDRAAVQAATHRFREGKGGFSDYLILESALRAGCESVATFEKDLLHEKGFRAP